MPPIAIAGCGLILASGLAFLLRTGPVAGAVLFGTGLALALSGEGAVLGAALTSLAILGAFLVAVWRAARTGKAIAGGRGLVGLEGTAETALPGGRVLVRGELWDARSREPIPAGRPVRVTGVRGLSLEVISPGDVSP
jgi:membrane-bound serine protease (ClpP class)